MFDVFITSVFIYIYLTLILRLLGKKEFSQLNVFDFVVFLIIAEIMTLSIGDDNITVFHSVVATLTLIAIDRIVSIVSIKFKRIRDIFEGKPSYIIFKGKVDRKKMRQLRYSIDDLCHHLRVSDIDSISKVEFAVLETNGSLSVIRKDECDVELPDTLICDGVIDKACLKLIGKDENWLKEELFKREVTDVNDVFYCVLEKEGLYIILK